MRKKYQQLVREIENGESSSDLLHSVYKLGSFLEDALSTQMWRGVAIGRSVAIGDRLIIDQDEWEVVQIAQDYDTDGNMLEPVVHLKMYLNAAWPLYRMTRTQKQARKQMSLSAFLNLQQQPTD